MGNLFKSSYINYMVACITIITFSTSTIMPLNLYALDSKIDLEAINFGIKIEKIFEKIKKAIDKGQTNKIVSYMFDLKLEVETFTGTNIDIAKQLNEVQRRAKAKGQKIENKHIKVLKSEFQKIENKHKHRADYMIECMKLDIPYTAFEADLHFDALYTSKNQNQPDKKDEVYIPITVTVGVTLSLCGLFLLFVPIPICSTSGGFLLETGLGILGSHALSKWDEFDREQQNEKKK